MERNAAQVFAFIGKQVAATRTRLGLTQEQAASKIGISQSLYAYYETGKRRIPITVLLKLAEVFNIHVEDLLPIEEEKRKRGPLPKLDQQLAKVKNLPENQQKLVTDLIESRSSGALSAPRGSVRAVASP